MTVPIRLLLVDDDEPMRDALAGQLTLHEDFRITTAATGGEALQRLANEPYDMILLDVGLPDMDGREVCRLVRRKGIHTPIILLTAMDSDADVILGLDAGANDFIAKPFRLGVLLARIRAQLRQHETSEDVTYLLGPYRFRPSARLMVHTETGKRIGLSEKECAILRHLYRAGDAAVGCEALYGEIWGHSTPLATHTLQTHIYRLRRKIEPEPGNPRILVSEGRGYRVVRRPLPEAEITEPSHRSD